MRVLVNDGHQVLVTLPHKVDRTTLSAYAGAEVAVVPTHRWMGRRQTGVAGVARLAQCLPDVARHANRIRACKPELIVVNTAVIPSPLVAARILRTPAVLLIRETLVTNPSLRSVLPRRWIRFLLHRLSTVAIVNSQFAASQYGYPASVVYPPVRHRFSRASSGRHAGNDGEALQIAMMGSLTPDKGHADAVTATALARANGVDLRMRIYGPGADEDVKALNHHIERLGVADVVTYEGSTAEPEVALSAADISLVCSRNEAYGKVTVESLLCGTPVIGYGLGGTLEILQHGGGLVTEPDPSAMAAAIEAVRENGTLERLQREADTNPAARASLTSDRALADLVVSAAEIHRGTRLRRSLRSFQR